MFQKSHFTTKGTKDAQRMHKGHKYKHLIMFSLCPLRFAFETFVVKCFHIWDDFFNKVILFFHFVTNSCIFIAASLPERMA